MAEKTVFQMIIDGEIPCTKIYEDDICIAIMDILPSVKGQSLVIPKEPVAYIFDLPDNTYHHILDISKKIARAMDIAFNTSRTCIVVEGFELPHTHIKLYPMSKNQTALTEVLTKTNPAEPKELEQNCEDIKNAL